MIYDINDYITDNKWDYEKLEETFGNPIVGKIMFECQGSTPKSPEPEYLVQVLEHPEVLHTKNNGKNWDWPRIRAAYSKLYPEITIDQCKLVLKKWRVTLTEPTVRIPPKLEDYPKDFSSAVNGKLWDYDQVADLYAKHGIGRADAIAHFKFLGVTLAKPTLSTGKRWAVPGHLFHKNFKGELYVDIPNGLKIPELSPDRISLSKANAVIKYWANKYSRKEVVKAAYHVFGIILDVNSFPKNP